MKLPSPVSPAHHFLLASMRFAWEHPSPLVSLSDMFQIVQAHPDVTDVANGLAKQADLRLPLHAALSALGMIAPIKFTTGSIQPAASPTALREHAIRQRPAGRRSQGDNIWLAYAFLRKLP
jgi:hypothetical protein